MSISAQQIKAEVTPERYYPAALNGAFGKLTGGDWHMWHGLCPFHMDTRPGSFVINKTTGAFRCFSCGARGSDIIAFHMKRHQVRFTDALNQLGGSNHA